MRHLRPSVNSICLTGWLNQGGSEAARIPAGVIVSIFQLRKSRCRYDRRLLTKERQRNSAVRAPEFHPPASLSHRYEPSTATSVRPVAVRLVDADIPADIVANCK